jgi:chlorite dismutase
MRGQRPPEAHDVTTKDGMDTLSQLGERLTYFTAGNHGQWKIRSITAVTGEGLAANASHLALSHAPAAPSSPAFWVLRGVSSNTRYVTKNEKADLIAKQSGLDRPEATRAALIPIRKNAVWWALSQEERRTIFETESHHTANSMPYLPAIARKLHHSRDIGEPFDFLTWFEYAPEYAGAFEELVRTLRASTEWTYVDREVDIRLERVSLSG